ncbi:condensation domain-containing protein [Streptomyces xanthophaeus]|uniref:condensation domain-containing protein n=1 Tax=Streptomyces xanthophaeus TaxID=67385 RepID=UPI0026489661|nr:condensation domain-containing protein [Streptomyces xanthophaeus]WKD32124.1 hypothetical protein KO717_09295 [Streptomyces xanthophaeus]
MTGSRRPAVERLTQGQQALWYLHRLAPDSAAYHVMCAVRVVGERRIDPELLGAAVAAVEARHDLLRSTFGEDEDGPHRVVRPAGLLTLDTVRTDASGEPLRERVRAAGTAPFRLGRESAFRIVLFDAGPEQVLLLAAHHIATDAASQALLLGDVLAAYQGLAEGTGLPWTGPAGDFGLQVAAERRLLADTERMDRLEEFWRTTCRGAAPVLDLPADRPRPARPGHRGGTVAATLDGERLDRLVRAAAAARTTPFVLLSAAFQVLLHRYTGEGEFLVGIPASSRRPRELRSTVGYFVNPMVLRASLDEDTTFWQLTRRTAERLRAAMPNQEYPFPMLPNALGVARDASRSPVFQVTFTLVSAGRLDPLTDLLTDVGGQRVLDHAGLRLAAYDLPQQEGQFDLAVEVLAGSGGMTALFRYSGDLFDRPTVERMSRHYLRLLDALTAEPDRRVAGVRLTDDEERALLLALSAGEPAPAAARAA